MRPTLTSTTANKVRPPTPSQTLLSLIGTIGNSLISWLLAPFYGVAWVWICYRVRETKGQSLQTRSSGR